MLFAIISIGLIGFTVWAHHMYVIGIITESRFYYSSVTLLIAIPTSIKVFTWLCSLLFIDCLSIICLLFVIGFILMFIIGGFTGIILANSNLDLILHDTYYVVDHFHFVLNLNAVIDVVIYLLLFTINLFNSI